MANQVGEGRNSQRGDQNGHEAQLQPDELSGQPDQRRAGQESAISGSGDGGDAETGRHTLCPSGRAEQDRYHVGEAQTKQSKAEYRANEPRRGQRNSHAESGDESAGAQQTGCTPLSPRPVPAESAGCHSQRKSGEPDSGSVHSGEPHLAQQDGGPVAYGALGHQRQQGEGTQPQ